MKEAGDIPENEQQLFKQNLVYNFALKTKPWIRSYFKHNCTHSLYRFVQIMQHVSVV